VNFNPVYEYVNFTTNVGELLKLENWTSLVNLHRRTKSLMDRNSLFIFLLHDFVVRMSNNDMEQMVFKRGMEIMEMDRRNKYWTEMVDKKVKTIVNWKRAKVYWCRRWKREEDMIKLKPLEIQCQMGCKRMDSKDAISFYRKEEETRLLIKEVKRREEERIEAERKKKHLLSSDDINFTYKVLCAYTRSMERNYIGR
jgi:hypothetical protein